MTCEIRPINALMASRENDNALLSPSECLQDTMADIRSGAVRCNKLLVVMLDAEDGRYDVRSAASNIRASEVVALCETVKNQFIRMLIE